MQTGGEEKCSSPPASGGNHRVRPICLRQIAADDRLDLRAGVPIGEARLNELLPRRDQVRLRRQDVEQRAGAEGIPLLHDAKSSSLACTLSSWMRMLSSARWSDPM